MSQQLASMKEDGSEPEVKDVQVLLYKDKVDGPLGAYLSMRDIKVGGSPSFPCLAGLALFCENCGRHHPGSFNRSFCKQFTHGWQVGNVTVQEGGRGQEEVRQL